MATATAVAVAASIFEALGMVFRVLTWGEGIWGKAGS